MAPSLQERYFVAVMEKRLIRWFLETQMKSLEIEIVFQRAFAPFIGGPCV